MHRVPCTTWWASKPTCVGLAKNRVFRMIPGLKNAEFVRYGVMHRNTYINSPRLLLNTLQLKTDLGIMFAGQITGVEGYIESTASRLVAGIGLWQR